MENSNKAANSRPKKLVVKDSKARVVKRPACGFHRFRGGALNVTPKGGEKELVRDNQNSPLLRLPPEVRMRIWELVLGGNMLRIGYVKNIYGAYQESQFPHPPAIESSKGADILRVCRQIYSECSLLPYKANTFTFGMLEYVKHDIRNLKRFQRAQIVKIQLEVIQLAGLRLPRHVPLGILATESRYARFTLGFLPFLKHIRVLIFGTAWATESFEKCESNVRKQLDVLLAGRQVDVTFERKNENWYDYTSKWDVEKPGV